MGHSKWLARTLVAILFLTGCAQPQEGQQEAEWTLVQEKAAVLTDGERVDLWRKADWPDDHYRLSDGTELLLVRDPIGPEAVRVAGQEGFEDLDDAARWTVRSYYEQQGLLYDVQEELEKAYTDYQECQESGRVYEERTVEQEITPTASNEKMMCFSTRVRLPLGGGLMEEHCKGAVFDRTTGSLIDLWSMFTAPQETVMERFLEAGDITDPAQYAEMAAAIRPELVLFYPEHLTVEFPPGALTLVDTPYAIVIDYPDLADILQDWAVPTTDS